MADINDIVTSVTTHGVLRNNRFRISADGVPTGVPSEHIANAAGAFANLYVQSTTTPDRSFANWSFTVMDDEEHNFRTAFEQWIRLIQKEEEAVRSLGLADCMHDWTVELLNETDDTPVRTYSLRHCFPVNVSGQDLNVGGASDPSTFTVEIAYNFFTQT